jgi:hypothetical protein
MLLAVCSDKGSPGATTAALALASVWSSPAVLVEADPYGGDLAIRLRTKAGAALPEAPTVLTVAAAARTSESPALVSRYAQQINDQVSVVAGHLVAEQRGGVADWEPFAAAVAASGVPVVADLGRLHAGSPVLPVAARADVVLVVARPDAGSVIRLRERLNRLVPALAAHRGAPPRLFPVLVSPHRHGAADVADVQRILAEAMAGPLIVGTGFLAQDPAAVARLEAGENPAGRLARTPLLRTAGTVAATLTVLVEPHAVAVSAAAPVRRGEEQGS